MTKYKGTYPSAYTTIDYGQKIGYEANRLAYTNNPKSAQYPSGKPTAAFKTTFAKVFKGFKFWNAWSKVGASCDVFVGTCIRSAYDSKCPAGLWKIEAHMKKRADYVQVKATADTLQDGDIIIYRKTPTLPKRGHICIYYKGKIKEASAKNYYGRTTDKVAARLSTSGKKYVHVYRVKDGKKYNPLKLNSSGTQVKRLQTYLNWYFAKDTDLKALKVDGDFGPITAKRVKLLQKRLGLVQDGIVGNKTLAKMKEVSI